MTEDKYLAGIMARDTPAQAPAGHAAIDLDAMQERWEWIVPTSPKGLVDLKQDGLTLIAAVKALRERVAELKVEKQGGWECLIKRAEAAEARVAELAGALEKIVQWQREKCETANAEILFMLLDNKVDIARAALAATPEEVMKRAKAIKIVAATARRYADDDYSHYDIKELEDALDALKEGG